MIQIRTKGGDRIKNLLARNLRNKGVELLRVGIVNKDRYPDGKFIAQIAVWNEFGTVHIPPRPAMRQSAAKISKEVGKELKPFLKGKDFKVPLQAADAVGQYMVRVIKQTIEDFDSPPNASSTVRRKGFNNPLIETRRYKRAINYKIGDAFDNLEG